MKRMVPVVGVSLPSTMRAIVVLPLPDSPTMVKTSGAASSSAKLTSFTARTLVRCEKSPRSRRSW